MMGNRSRRLLVGLLVVMFVAGGALSIHRSTSTATGSSLTVDAAVTDVGLDADTEVVATIGPGDSLTGFDVVLTFDISVILVAEITAGESWATPMFTATFDNLAGALRVVSSVPAPTCVDQPACLLFTVTWEALSVGTSPIASGPVELAGPIGVFSAVETHEGSVEVSGAPNADETPTGPLPDIDTPSAVPEETPNSTVPPGGLEGESPTPSQSAAASPGPSSTPTPGSPTSTGESNGGGLTSSPAAEAGPQPPSAGSGVQTVSLRFGALGVALMAISTALALVVALAPARGQPSRSSIGHSVESYLDQLEHVAGRDELGRNQPPR